MKPRRNDILRRRLLSGAGAACVVAGLGGCDQLSQSPTVANWLDAGAALDQWAQRLLLSRTTLAAEYPARDINRHFRPNGSTDPDDPEYRRLARNGFRDWRLIVDGLVARKLSLSLDELRALPSRTQITRHDCVEGWSCIGQWQGARLSAVLARAGLLPGARYVVFHCADTLEQTLDDTGQYYESIDLFDALHPQTILAYAMNHRPLPVPYGAPLRLRVERQLGYKMAKYLMRLEVVNSFAGISRGHGGFWEDRGYAWYAGI